MTKTFIIIGDCHFPFTNLDALYGKGGIIEAIKKLRPDYVIQIGDLYDMYSWSKFPFKRDIYTPEAEMGSGRELAESMWKNVKRASRWSKCYQLIGNHDERPAKRLLEKNPEFMSFYKSIHNELFTFPGVHTQESQRDELVIGDVLFMHGFRSKLGDHTNHNRMSTVTGHSHTGGCVFIRNGDSILWELNAGYIGDPNSVPLSYTRQRTISRWTQGFGIIDSYGPRFVPIHGTKK